jgi:TolB-like protein/Tfp pilus assembly protein PilF
MSFFDELKRRNVFRVAIGYVITAWLLLQVVDLVLENVNAPDWVMQVFMLALAIGFPLAIFFAWAFEMTPEGVRLEKDVDRSQSITNVTAQKMNRNIMIAMAIAVVFLLVDRFGLNTAQDSGSEQDSVSITRETSQDTLQPGNDSTDENLNPAPTEKSIAVLPFVDMSPESDQAYFADGISEEILNVLVKTRSLKVAGRTSSFQFRDGNGDLKSIGEQLGVDHILEGSIRKANNRVRITAQLVTANDGFHLWSESYDRDLTDIFAIQDEIARAIADALAIELDLGGSGQELVKVTTSNMDAYDRYLEGRGLIARRQDFPRAIDLLNEAVEIDPNFAAGWAANAQANALSIYYVPGDHTDTMKLAESMANKALEIDPNLSMAHSVLGDIYRDRYEWMKAKNSYLRALALNPDDVEANEQYGQMLWRANYFEEAFKYSSKAAELDPLSQLYVIINAGLRYVNGDHEGALADINRVLEISDSKLNIDFPLQWGIILSLSEGMPERAIELTKDFANFQVVKAYDPAITEHYRQLVQVLNSREDTLAFLAPGEYETTAPISTFYWAIDVAWAAYYGDFDLAGKIMEAGALHDERVSSMDLTFINYPFLGPVHNSGAYKRLVRKIGLDDFWRESGYPEYCKPVGEDDFVCK